MADDPQKGLFNGIFSLLGQGVYLEASLSDIVHTGLTGQTRSADGPACLNIRLLPYLEARQFNQMLYQIPAEAGTSLLTSDLVVGI